MPDFKDNLKVFFLQHEERTCMQGHTSRKIAYVPIFAESLRFSLFSAKPLETKSVIALTFPRVNVCFKISLHKFTLLECYSLKCSQGVQNRKEYSKTITTLKVVYNSCPKEGKKQITAKTG